MRFSLSCRGGKVKGTSRTWMASPSAGFSPWQPLAAIHLLREVDADIYHLCEPSLTGYLALRAMPDGGTW